MSNQRLDIDQRIMGTSRIVLGFSILFGLLLAFGTNAQSLICLSALLILIASGLRHIAHKVAPNNLLLLLIGLALGPSLVCLLLRALVHYLEIIFGSPISKIALLLFLLGLMVISYIYTRARIAHWIDDERASLHTNERQPLPPVPQEHEEEQ